MPSPLLPSLPWCVHRCLSLTRRAICQDLPLTDAGDPQLPATPATRQRVLLAMLAAARCHYIW